MHSVPSGNLSLTKIVNKEKGHEGARMLLVLFISQISVIVGS